MCRDPAALQPTLLDLPKPLSKHDPRGLGWGSAACRPYALLLTIADQGHVSHLSAGPRGRADTH